MTHSKAVPSLLRTLNERTVFDVIRAESPISRAEVARRTGISKPTVSLALRVLEGAGLVRETRPAPGAPHYGATYYEADPEAALVLAADIGARFVRGAICDLHGNLRARHDVRTAGAIVSTLAAVASLRRSLAETVGLNPDRLSQVVVGVPGVVSETDGRIALPGHVLGLGDIDLRTQLEDALQLPIRLENDVNLAALGEQWRGAARGVDDFAFLSVGTGLGAAVVLGGKLHRGRNGAAGEVDAVRSGRLDEIDPCADALSAYAATETTVPEPYDLPAVFAAARTGDAQASKVVAEAARRIALHVLPLAVTLDLPLVILGGGIGANGDLLLEPIRRRLSEWLPFPPPVTTSSLGDAAVLTGALATGCAAALEDIFKQRTAH
jgi:predicted NBD/HSP70 family sugar kinase